MRANRWLVFVGAAVLVHLALFLYIKPSAVQFVRRAVHPASENSAAPGGHPDAVLSIPVEYEHTEQEPVPLLSVEEETEERHTVEPTNDFAPPAALGPSSGSELGGLVGDASRTIPRGSVPDLVKIPPRPLQITWPDTRRLKHCLGHQIRVRIQVDEEGAIVRVEIPDDEHPADCVSAALESAGQILFAPGTIGGKPVKMWTEIRIDVRRKA